MKFLEKEFPKGTFKKQTSDGAYIDGFLAGNLDVYAKKIIKDMHFLLIISGNDSVGNGKSTLATQIGTYITAKVNELHGTKNTFTSDNINMSSKKLVDVSFKLPPYSVVVLDEGDDLTTHGMKDAAVQLKRYFRKCRQLNQILILIIPSFFELPKFYALARSHCLINVKFHGEFDRGAFDFYGPNQKKRLYLKGKRDWDYNAANPDFNGGFFSSYCFFPNLEEEIEKYKGKKYEDMIDDHDEKKGSLTAVQIERRVIAKYVNMANKVLTDKYKISQPDIAKAFGVSTRSVRKYVNEGYGEIFDSEKSDLGMRRGNTN